MMLFRNIKVEVKEKCTVCKNGKWRPRVSRWGKAWKHQVSKGETEELLFLKSCSVSCLEVPQIFWHIAAEDLIVVDSLYWFRKSERKYQKSIFTFFKTPKNASEGWKFFSTTETYLLNKWLWPHGCSLIRKQPKLGFGFPESSDYVNHNLLTRCALHVDGALCSSQPLVDAF